MFEIIREVEGCPVISNISHTLQNISLFPKAIAAIRAHEKCFLPACTYLGTKCACKVCADATYSCVQITCKPVQHWIPRCAVPSAATLSYVSSNIQWIGLD